MSNNIRKLDRRGILDGSLAKRLTTLDYFLYATNEAMKFDQLEDCDLQPYGEKIITLTEVARRTLRQRMGVSLIMLCSKEHVPYKAAYFKLLVWIRRRRSAFPTNIDDRINSLLEDINHKTVLRTRGIDPRVQLGIEELIIIKKRQPDAGNSSEAVCSQISNESPTL